jgi:hypothetical protein
LPGLLKQGKEVPFPKPSKALMIHLELVEFLAVVDCERREERDV